jgi:hypothetical protein
MKDNILNFDSWNIFEAKESKDAKPQMAIMFTDVVSSSKQWMDNPKGMSKWVDQHLLRIDKIVTKHKGFIVKTIGDAMMVCFKGKHCLLNAVESAEEILRTEKKKLRIGICQGDITEKIQRIQNSNLKDYFGNPVNTASRLESKVSDEEGLAFAHLEDIDLHESTELTEWLGKHDYEVIKYTDTPSKPKIGKLRKRSARLLSDLQISAHADLQELKGIHRVVAYKVKLKK